MTYVEQSRGRSSVARPTREDGPPAAPITIEGGTDVETGDLFTLGVNVGEQESTCCPGGNCY